MVEGARLESVFGSKAQREFESRPVRHFPDNMLRLLTLALGFCLLHSHFLPYLVIPDFFLLSFPRKRESKMPGPAELQGLFFFLDLRVKPEDDNTKNRQKMTRKKQGRR